MDLDEIRDDLDPMEEAAHAPEDEEAAELDPQGRKKKDLIDDTESLEDLSEDELDEEEDVFEDQEVDDR